MGLFLICINMFWSWKGAHGADEHPFLGTVDEQEESSKHQTTRCEDCQRFGERTAKNSTHGATKDKRPQQRRRERIYKQTVRRKKNHEQDAKTTRTTTKTQSKPAPAGPEKFFIVKST